MNNKLCKYNEIRLCLFVSSGIKSKSNCLFLIECKKLITTNYPFGMLKMQAQEYASEAYSWGFNGKEKDDEISGGGNNLDFGARIYDSRLGRWMSVDPNQNSPGLTPYRGFFNNPIYIISPDGKFEIKGSTGGKTKAETNRIAE